MIKLYEELVKLCMVCMQTQYRVRDLNSLSSQDLGGGGGGIYEQAFTLPRLWIYEGPQANGLGRGTEMEQANSLHAWQEGLSLLNTLLETINAHLYRYQR